MSRKLAHFDHINADTSEMVRREAEENKTDAEIEANQCHSPLSRSLLNPPFPVQANGSGLTTGSVVLLETTKTT